MERQTEERLEKWRHPEQQEDETLLCNATPAGAGGLLWDTIRTGTVAYNYWEEGMPVLPEHQPIFVKTAELCRKGVGHQVVGATFVPVQVW